MGIVSRASAAACTFSGTPADFAAEQHDVVGPEGVIEIGKAGVGGEQHEPTAIRAPIREGLPASVTHDRDLIEIVHAGTAEGAVGGRKAGRLDNVRLDAEAGAQA